MKIGWLFFLRVWALGAAVGLGMMTKFTMAFLLAGIVGGVLLTKPRWLLKKWLWCMQATPEGQNLGKA